MKRIMTVIGTRPEAIKLAPVVLELSKHSGQVKSLVCVTAQHRQMLDQVLEWFAIKSDYDLNLMSHNQSLAELASRVLVSISSLLETVHPDLVIVQGDTTTSMMTALSAFYQHIPVGHVEAGLRTQSRYNPFPEEINRRLTGTLASFHFAPTARAAKALLDEQVPENSIFVTGNTVVDALQMTARCPVHVDVGFHMDGRRFILVTAHRRESFGASFESMCLALKDLAERNSDIEIVYPVHFNPNVREPVSRILSNHPRIHLIEPLCYQQFVHLMKKSYLILTDSGGIQEEAPVFGKPTLVMRETTERLEAIEAGTARLVGTDRFRIVTEAELLLHSPNAYQAMTQAGSPFGDGKAAKRVVAILMSKMLESTELEICKRNS